MSTTLHPSADVDGSAFLAALAGLPGMGPIRLRALLELGPPDAVWAAVRAGATADGRPLAAAIGGAASAPAVVSTWRQAAALVSVEAVATLHRANGVQLLTPDDPRWPRRLLLDPEPPAILCCQGDAAVLAQPTVAIVGTRSCTAEGRSIATELAADLAAGGACVVSGLALGIDAAAHRGSLAHGPGRAAAVVATGLDVRYPAANRRLWGEVADAGVVCGEAPLGTRPERWRFPARNRIVAALAQVVVVVESHGQGGSMHTVESALERDRTVLAVPGSIRSPASAGTNGLLGSGATPCCGAADVWMALGLDARGRPPAPAVACAGDGAPTLPFGSSSEQVLLAAFRGIEQTIDDLVTASGLGLPEVLHALGRLEDAGTIVAGPGWWRPVERQR